MKNSITKIIGGHAGYKKAVNEAFRANMHSPSVIYSRQDGFYVGSALVPCDDNEWSFGEVSYSANTGDRSMSGSKSEYDTNRDLLLAWMNALDRGMSPRQARAIAFDSVRSEDY
jgi:hypothetical protein